MTAPQMISGFGQFHTNEPDAKKRRPYVAIDLAGIRALVDNPQRVDKAQAQWFIPSTLPSRAFKEQEQRGEFWMLWADLDKEPQPLQSVEATLLFGILAGADFELYTSRSATQKRQKARIIVPLAKPLSGGDWVLCQQVLNDMLTDAGIEPDRASERPGQLCYLPNAGEFYEARHQRNGDCFDPLTAWAAELAEKRSSIQRKAAELEASRKAAAERREALQLTDATDTIAAFNTSFTVMEVLLRAGYDQRGDTFRHPQSESGSYSASVKDGRVHSLSSTDPLYTGGAGGGAHDAFSAFAVLYAGGDTEEALKLAGDRWLTVNGESWNKARQREFMQRKDAETLPQAFDSIASEQAPGLRKGFAFVSAGDLLGTPKPVDFLIDELIEQPSLCLLFAPSGAGKSFLAISWAACVATGTHWLGRDVKQGPVFYLAGEGHAGIARRLRAWEIHNGANLKDAPLYVSTVPAALMDIKSAASVVDSIAELESLHGKPALIVIDTFARNMGDGDENSNADVGVFVNHVDLMRARLGATMLLVHHSGHAEKDRARGGSALNAAMDATFQVELKASGQIVLQQRKAKESELAQPMAFELEQVVLPGWHDAKGRPMQSAVLIAASEAPNLERGKPLSQQQREGLESFYRAAVACGTETSETKLGVPLEDWRTEFYRTCTADGQSAKKVAFQRVRKDLVNRGLLNVDNDTYSIDMLDGGLIAARLAANFASGTNGTQRNKAEQCSGAFPLATERNGTHSLRSVPYVPGDAEPLGVDDLSMANE